MRHIKAFTFLLFSLFTISAYAGSGDTAGISSPTVDRRGSVSSPFYVNSNITAADQSITVTTQDIFHFQTHKGDRYSLVTHQTITGSGTFYVLLTAPATTLTHFQWSAESTNEAHVHLYESPIASGGTPYFTPNRNRNSANVASLIVTSGPTVTNTGTLLSAHNLITGKNQGGSTVGDEWVWKQSTPYLFEFINLIAQPIEMDFEFRWSEFNM